MNLWSNTKNKGGRFKIEYAFGELKECADERSAELTRIPKKER